MAGVSLFSDPPNGEIIEQFRQMERATERRMIVVREIRFPEDVAPTGGSGNPLTYLLAKQIVAKSNPRLLNVKLS